MAERTLFEIDFESNQKGWLWAVTSLYLQKSTGILSLERSNKNGVAIKKEVAFEKGDPIAIRSNILSETFGAFLVQKKIISKEQLDNALEERKALNSNKPLGEWFVSKGLLQAMEAGRYLEEHFQQRLCSGMDSQEGVLKFFPLSPLPSKVFEDGAIRLSVPTLHLLWKGAIQFYQEDYCRWRLRAFHSDTEFRVQGELPFAIPPADLRRWKNLLTSPKKFSQLEGLDLALVTMALEFENIQVKEAAVEEEKTAAPKKIVIPEKPQSGSSNPSPSVASHIILSQDQINLEKKLGEVIESYKVKKAHDILGVRVEASIVEVKKAYLNLVKQYHPDRLSKGTSDEVRRLTEQIISLVNEANSIMTSPEKLEDLKAEIKFESQGGIKGVEDRIEAEMLFDQAKSALRRRHFSAALENLKKVTVVIKEDGEMLADLIYAEFMSRVESKQSISSSIRDYLERLDRAISMRENYSGAYYYKGVLYKLKGDTQKALRFFDKAIEMDPKFNEAQSEARLLRMKKGKDEKTKKKGWFS